MSNGRPTRVSLRDWVLIALAAAVVIGLAIYLVVRPADGDSATGSASDAGRSPAPVQSSPGSEQSSPAPAQSSPSATSAGSSPSGTAPGSASMPGAASPVQPPGSAADRSSVRSAAPPGSSGAPPPSSYVQPSHGQKAPRIGPFGDLARRQPDDPRALGNRNAPVVMVMYSDFRCPFCAQFSRDTEPKLVDKYVTPGTLRIEWRDAPIFGEQSVKAAMAGRAAGQQGRFWEFTSAVYADAPKSGHPDLTDDALINYAKAAGVKDLAAFRAGLADAGLRREVMQELDAANEIGVPSTPAFVINGYPLVGSQPLAEFTKLIDTVQTLE